MSATSKIITFGTALVIGAGSLTATAQAAPLPGATAKVEIGSAVDTVKWKGKHHGHHGHHGHGRGPGWYGPGAAVVGLGAFALGAAIASSTAYDEAVCYRQKVKVWSERRQAYVIRTQTVCD